MENEINLDRKTSDIVQNKSEHLEKKSEEFQLIAVKPTDAPRSREHHEGIKAKASDVHNWNNRIYL